jgi:hypothetical protein
MGITLGTPNPMAYCSRKKVTLSLHQIKCKGCMDPEKQKHNKNLCCKFLRKIKTHPAWEYLRKKKELKAKRKAEKKNK